MRELLGSPEDGGFSLELHRAMVFDEPRLAAFERALAAVVRPGDTVVDVGSGTGILSFLACRAGAGRVVGIERGEIVETARRVRERHYADAPVEFLRLDVVREALPEIEADVLVCELIGNLGPDEGIVPIVARVRSHLLRPGGRVIPARIRTVACPVEAPAVHAELSRWSEAPGGIRLEAFQELAWARVYSLEAEEVRGLATGRTIAEVDLTRDERAPELLAGEFEVLRGGRTHGVVAWVEAELAAGVVLSTRGEAGETTHWGRVFLPAGEGLEVEAGQRLRFELEIEEGDFEAEWRWRIEVEGGERVAFSTRGSSLR